jgi:hypothetical protein
VEGVQLNRCREGEEYSYMVRLPGEEVVDRAI